MNHSEHDGGRPTNLWRPSGITISAILLGFIVLLAVAFVAGYVPLQRREATVRAEADEREKSLPRVTVMRVSHGSGKNELTLPGTMQAVMEAPLLARADGYLKRRLVDIGDHVRVGQVLAEIDAPELDHQTRQAAAAVEQAKAALEQTQANLEQGKANRELARITAERWKTLLGRGLVARQDSDQYQAQLAAQNANVQALEKAVAAQNSSVASANANLSRLQEVENYSLVKAPFDGIITVRNVDVGALVTAGTTLLYRIAQIERLRTYVNVPQASANAIHDGQPAALTVSNFPGRIFHGMVARTANVLDPASRTMLVEVDVPNGDRSLFPGMYANVDLSGSRSNPPLVLPATTIIFRTDGAQVAVVQDGTVHLQKVTVGRDYGDRVEILQGLADDADIITNPGDSAREGAKIIPVSAESSPK